MSSEQHLDVVDAGRPESDALAVDDQAGRVRSSPHTDDHIRLWHGQRHELVANRRGEAPGGSRPGRAQPACQRGHLSA
jgi:hypothetical protein